MQPGSISTPGPGPVSISCLGVPISTYFFPLAPAVPDSGISISAAMWPFHRTQTNGCCLVASPEHLLRLPHSRVSRFDPDGS